MNNEKLPAAQKPRERPAPPSDYHGLSWVLNQKLLALIKPMETLQRRPDQETARYCVGRWGEVVNSMRYTGGLEWVNLWYREETDMYEDLKAAAASGEKSPQEVLVWLDVGVKRMRASLKLMREVEVRMPFPNQAVDGAIHKYITEKLTRD